MTQEAVGLYLAKLTPGGVLLFHVSNRYLDLTQVVAQAAARLKLAALVQHDVALSDKETAEGKLPSSWVVLARQQQTLASLAADPRWMPLAGNGQVDAWTDDYSNILQVLRWK